MVNNIPPGNFARKSVGLKVGNRLGQDGGLAFEIYDDTANIDLEQVDEGDVYLVDDETEGLSFFAYDGTDWVLL